MATMSIETTQATRGDTAAIALTLAQAFQDDPVFCWVVPDDARRRITLPGVFAAFAAGFTPHGWSRLAVDAAGASLASPPGVAPIAEEDAERFGEEFLGAFDDEADVARAAELDALLEAQHPDEPCAYLGLLGVVPARHGGGIGSALLLELLDRCDVQDVAAYLEATSLDNRRLYERHGFRVTGELAVSGGPPLWPMWREPRRAT